MDSYKMGKYRFEIVFVYGQYDVILFIGCV